MRKRFVLIDPTLRGIGGHHYEYARLVLLAAKEQGYQTIVGVGKQCLALEGIGADVVMPSFSRDYWENALAEHPSFFRTLIELLRDFRKRGLGTFLWLVRYGVVAVRSWISESATFPAGKPVIFHLFADQFASECASLLEEHALQEDGMVFVPTAGAVEDAGVRQCAATGRWPGLTWHLLFRRDPAICTPVNSANDRLGSKIFRYTDTDSLTYEYRALHGLCFKTIPIPVEAPKRRRTGLGKPLVFSYLGDVREEKGFHYLPELVERIRGLGYTKNEVLFCFQSNHATSKPTERSIRAVRVFGSPGDNGVELICGPLSSDDYRRLLERSDVILLPYDPDRYSRRSSGIFVEAIASGIPVIYPRLTWMGMTLCNVDEQYARFIERNSPVSEWARSRNMRITIPASMGSQTLFMRCLVTSTGDCGMYCLRLQCIPKDAAAGEESRLSTCITMPLMASDPHSEHMMFVQSVPPGDYVASLGRILVDAGESGDAHHSQFELYYRTIPQQGLVSAQAVSRGFNSVETISDAVVELLEYYRDYQQRCQRFSENWRAFHSANSLVSCLENAANDGCDGHD